MSKDYLKKKIVGEHKLTHHEIHYIWEAYKKECRDKGIAWSYVGFLHYKKDYIEKKYGEKSEERT